MCVTVHVSLEQVYSVCYCACVIGAGIQCVLLCMCHWSRYTVCVTVHVSLEQVYSVRDCACVIGGFSVACTCIDI